MFLKLKEAIRAGGKQYRAPSVVDTKELGISDEQAKVLILRGSAVEHNEKAAAREEKQAGGPEVVKVDASEPKAAKPAKAAAKTAAKE